MGKKVSEKEQKASVSVTVERQVQRQEGQHIQLEPNVNQSSEITILEEVFNNFLGSDSVGSPETNHPVHEGGQAPSTRLNSSGVLLRAKAETSAHIVISTWDDIERIIRHLGQDPQAEYDNRVQAAKDLAAIEVTSLRNRQTRQIEAIVASDAGPDARAVAVRELRDTERLDIAAVKSQLESAIETESGALIVRKEERAEAVGTVKTRLRTMLATQYRYVLYVEDGY